MQTAELAAAVEAVATAAGWALAALAPSAAPRVPSTELLASCVQLLRARGAVEAAYLTLVAEIDQRRRDGALVGDGGFGESSTEGFLRTSAPMTPGQARSDVAAARSVAPSGTLAAMAQQLAQGEVTRAHVDVSVRCLDAIPGALQSTPQQRRVICRFLTDLGPTGHSQDLRRAAGALLDRLAPEVQDQFDPAALDRRYLDLATDQTGMVVGRFALDAVAGATLRAAIDAVSAPAPADRMVGGSSCPARDSGGGQDVGADRGVLGVAVAVDALGRDDRTARQRRADALTLLVGTAMAAEAPRRGERPRVVVHTSADQLAALSPAGLAGPARTESGQQLGGGALRRLACDAVLQRVVRGGDGSPLAAASLSLGREQRLATVPQRRALAARDRGCVVPGCGAQPGWCDAHHIVHWADGGPTDLDNLVLLCGTHHSGVHSGTWAVRMAADGIPEVVPPARLDLHRRPRRAPHHHVGAAVHALDTARHPDVGESGTDPPDWRPPGAPERPREPRYLRPRSSGPEMAEAVAATGRARRC